MDLIREVITRIYHSCGNWVVGSGCNWRLVTGACEKRDADGRMRPSERSDKTGGTGIEWQKEITPVVHSFVVLGLRD
jgi:hypothetical protein